MDTNKVRFCQIFIRLQDKKLHIMRTSISQEVYRSPQPCALLVGHFFFGHSIFVVGSVFFILFIKKRLLQEGLPVSLFLSRKLDRKIGPNRIYTELTDSHSTGQYDLHISHSRGSECITKAKHIDTRVCKVRELSSGDNPEVKLWKIDGSDQPSNIFTKALPSVSFE